MSGEDETGRPGERGGTDGRADRGDRGRRRDVPMPERPDEQPTGHHGAPASSACFPRAARITAAVLGPVLLTTVYFTAPFDLLRHGDHPLAWVILGGLLVLLAAGMLVTTVNALTARP